MASNRNGPWFRRVMQLPVAALGSSDTPAISLKALDDVANFHAGHRPLLTTHSPSSTAASTPAPAPCFLPPRPREPFPSSGTGSRGWCAPECRRDRYPKFVGQLRWLRRND